MGQDEPLWAKPRSLKRVIARPGFLAIEGYRSRSRGNMFLSLSGWTRKTHGRLVLTDEAGVTVTAKRDLKLIRFIAVRRF